MKTAATPTERVYAALKRLVDQFDGDPDWDFNTQQEAYERARAALRAYEDEKFPG
jgi:hypothetical protein